MNIHERKGQFIYTEARSKILVLIAHAEMPLISLCIQRSKMVSDVECLFPVFILMDFENASPKLNHLWLKD